MKRLLLSFLTFTAVQSSLMLAAFASQQFRVSEKLGPVRAPAGKKLSSDTISAGFAAMTVLAKHLKLQITALESAIAAQQFQIAHNLYDDIKGLYAIIKEQQASAFLIERLRMEMDGIQLNDQLIAQYEQALVSLRNR